VQAQAAYIVWMEEVAKMPQTLADLPQLQVETTDLSQRDLTEVQVGQEAIVYVEALDVDVPGPVDPYLAASVHVGWRRGLHGGQRTTADCWAW
jgi:hypothetical protein